MMIRETKWIRVTKGHPCPICGKNDWCGVTEDRSAAHCMRVESPRPVQSGGYLHILKEQNKSVRRSTLKIQQPESPSKISDLANYYDSIMTPPLLLGIAAALGVSSASLSRLRVGYDGQAYTFPMQNASGPVVGIRRRFPNGRKVCVPGSRNGLFVPAELTGTGTLLIVEGNSDAAAALDLGFEAIGRPNCNSCVSETIKFVRQFHYSRIVIIPDNDAAKPDGSNPGLNGGIRLANQIRLYCRDVRLVIPPSSIKDLRNWLNHGLVRAELDSLIEAAKPVQLEVHHES